MPPLPVFSGGDTNTLVALFAITVFVGFALAQAGMVLHWCEAKGPGWRGKAALGGLGAVLTGVSAVVVTATEFHDGAWLIVVALPLLVAALGVTSGVGRRPRPGSAREALGSRQRQACGRKRGVNRRQYLARDAFSSRSPTFIRTSSGALDGRRGLRCHHGRGLRAGGVHRQGGGEAVTAENIVGLIVAVALLGYLILALVKPERF